MHKGIVDPNAKLSGIKNVIISSFVKLLPQIIREQNASAPIGWFIGFIATMNLIAILLVTKIEYESTQKLSNKNKKKLKSVKGVFISIVVSVVLISIISYFLLVGTVNQFQIFNQTIDLSTFMNAKALMFLATYTFGASVYTLDTSRKLHKLFVNDLIAN
jgi:riboflavin transporter FmnP